MYRVRCHDCGAEVSLPSSRIISTRDVDDWTVVTLRDWRDHEVTTVVGRAHAPRPVADVRPATVGMPA